MLVTVKSTVKNIKPSPVRLGKQPYAKYSVRVMEKI